MILGNARPGTTVFALGGDRKQLIDVTLGRLAYLTDLAVLLDGGGSTVAQDVMGVVYERVTNTLVAASAPLTIMPGDAPDWQQLTFATHPLLAPGGLAIGVHAGPFTDGVLHGAARGFHSGGPGLTEVDTFADGSSTTLTPTATSTGLSIITTLSLPWTPPTTADEEYLGTLPMAEAQSVFSSGAASDQQLVRVGWHGTKTDPSTGSFAVVKEGGILEGLLGERVRIEVNKRSTCVYIRDALAIAEDISLTRRSFMEVAAPSATYLEGLLEVMT